MYSIHNRDNLDKLKQIARNKIFTTQRKVKRETRETRLSLRYGRNLEPVTTKQVEATETQIQALHDSAQTTKQAIENQTRATQQNSDNLQKSNKQGIQYYDEIANRNNQLLTGLVNSNQVEYSIVKTVSNLFKDKNKRQFSLEPITQGTGNRNSFTINPSNPQHVMTKGSTMTFENGNSYNVNDPDLQYFITNIKFDREINNKTMIYSFLIEMKYNINYGDKNLFRYYFFKDLYNQYYQHLGSGFVFLPSDPDE